MNSFFSLTNIADILGVSNTTVRSWVKKGKLSLSIGDNGKEGFWGYQLFGFPEIDAMINTEWEKELDVKPLREYTSAELFAGGGGLAIGMEKAGFNHVLLNEYDKDACKTLRYNRPNWNVIEGDIHNIDFNKYRDQIDFLSGGFPCQAFSYAGNKGGFEDARGTLFF